VLGAAALAFGVVFLAELGDKSQLLVLSLSTRFSKLPVLLGVSLAVLFMQALSVVAGGFIADHVPRRPVEIVAGILFLAFAVWTLRGGGDDDRDVEPVRRSAVIASALAFVAAEFGDKTMLATAGLATREDRFGTWLGSSGALIVSAGLAVLVGAALGRRFDRAKLRYAAAVAFAAVGILLLLGAG
jgi:putative Ca2+/H+ antiporter (TMEM165/GDT1 family)